MHLRPEVRLRPEVLRRLRLLRQTNSVVPEVRRLLRQINSVPEVRLLRPDVLHPEDIMRPDVIIRPDVLRPEVRPDVLRPELLRLHPDDPLASIGSLYKYDPPSTSRNAS